MYLYGSYNQVKLPKGVLNVLTGFGPDAGAPLSNHPGKNRNSEIYLSRLLISYFD